MESSSTNAPPPPEQPQDDAWDTTWYTGAGDVVALEPSTEPVHPLRASDVVALLAKNIA